MKPRKEDEGSNEMYQMINGRKTDIYLMWTDILPDELVSSLLSITDPEEQKKRIDEEIEKFLSKIQRKRK